MGFFSYPYDTNLEVSCLPLNKLGRYKKVGEKVRFIDRMYVTPVKVSEARGPPSNASPGYKFYVNKTDVGKIKTGTITQLSDDRDGTAEYQVTTPDGLVIKNQLSSEKLHGTFKCYQTGTTLFVVEDSIVGGKKRRHTKKYRKSKKSQHRTKSRKHRK